MATTFKPTLPASTLDGIALDIRTTPYIYTLVRHVSRSGMQRRISVFMVRNGEISNISVAVAQLLKARVDERDHGIVVHGAGMDMAWNLVYTLSRKLYANAGIEGDPGYQLTHRAL